MELPVDGRKPESEQVDDQQRVAESQSEAAPDQVLQVVERSPVFGEADRRGGSVSESSATSPGAVCGREDPDSSVGPHTAGLALEEGTPGHDDARLQAQRDNDVVLQGKVIGQCYERHRHQEFLRFLRRLDQEFPGKTPLHLVMDNYGTHKHLKVAAWLKRHPRFIPHFVPTSSSWLNLVERWFGELTSKRIRRGSFVNVEDLKNAIAEFLDAWNENPKPFVWTATVESIQKKLARCRQTLEQIQPGCTQPRIKKKRK